MDRSRLYKNAGKDNEELRRRRIDQSVELRKAKKNEQLQKRRNVLDNLEETSPLKNIQVPETPIDYDRIVANMKNSCEKVRLDAIQLCRKTLSRARNPPIDEFHNRGAVKILINALDEDDDSIVFESAWALTNIASGESNFTQAVVDGGASPKLIKLLRHKDIRIAEQCIWALGNIAGDGTNFRDMLIRLGVVSPVLEVLEKSYNTSSVVSNVAWMLSNLCRNKNPRPPRETLSQLLPIFAKLLDYNLSQEVVIDTTWALSYAGDGAGEIIDDIIHSGCVSRLIQLLGSDSPNLVTPALRAVGNLVLGDDDQTQAIVDAGVLNCIPKLLQSDRSSIVKEGCWMLSNITAGSLLQIQAVIDAQLVDKVIFQIHNGDFKVQREACWVLSNIINGGSPDQRAHLLNQGALAALSKLLTVSDARVVTLVLETIRKIFETADEYGQLEPCCLALEQCGGLDAIEGLQDHANENVYAASFYLIERYFSDSEDVQGAEQATGDEQKPLTHDQNPDEFHFQPQESQNGAATKFDF